MPSRNVSVLCGTIFCTLCGVLSWYRILPNRLREWGATEEQVGLVFMFFVMAHRLLQVFGGLLADHFGRKKLVAVITFLMAPFYLIAAFMPTWPLMIASLLVVWVLSSFQWPALLSLVADSVPEERRGRAIGFLETSIVLGCTGGPFLGMWLYRFLDNRLDLTVHWLLIGTSLLYLVCGTVRALGLRETVSPRASWSLSHFHNLDLRVLLLPSLLSVLMFMIHFLTDDGPFVSLYVRDELHMDEYWVNYLNFLGGLTAIIAAMVAGTLTDRLGAPRVMFWTFSGAVLLLLPFAASYVSGVRPRDYAPGLDYVLMVGTFLPCEIYFVSYQKLITSATPGEHRAFAIGLVNSCIGVFAAVSMYIGGLLYQRVDPLAPFTLAAACALVGMSFALYLHNHSRRHPQRSLSPAPTGFFG